MINYIEKGFALHEEIARQGYKLYQLDGVWVSDNDEAVQTIIDSFQVNNPNWDNFNLQIFSNTRFNQVYGTALQQAPVVASSLAVAVDQITTKGFTLFSIVYPLICQLGGATIEDKLVWANIAQENFLPQDFIDVLRG